MTRPKFQMKLAGALGCLLALGGATVFSQPTVAPPAQVLVQPVQAHKPDPFDNLITTAASFDIDSPVMARAEFDPPLAVAGQRVVYRIEVSALEESLKAPDQLSAPAGLEFRAGGHGQIYQPTGSMKLQPRTTYLYHVTANAAGNFSMPSFDVLAYGKPVKVPATTLTVVAKGSAPVQEPPGLLLDLPGGDVYAGQLLRMQLILPDTGNGRVHGFARSHITGEFIFSEPMFMGMRRDTIERGGKTFPAFIEETVVTPMREGRQKIIAQAYAIVARPLPGQSNINIVQMTQMLIDSDPVTLEVKGLPTQGRLPGFMGAVGMFQIDPPRLSTNYVRAGEPVTLTVIVRGEGNIGRMTLPPVPLLKEWQAVPPVGESIPPAFVQQRGFGNFTYTLIPLSDQIKATPAIPFSYFNPMRKAYVDLTIPSVPLTVAPGLDGTTISPTENDDSANAEHEPALTGLAKQPGRVVMSLVPVQQRAWFLWLQLLPAAGLGGLWFWDSRRRFHARHPEVKLKRRARRGLRRQLRNARRAAAAGDAAGFASGAANALREACAPHNAANPDALVCADVLQELPEPERETKYGEVVRRLFAAADARRFGGADRNGKDLLTLQPDLEKLLAQLKERL